uniref:Platelet-derived growth factor receptor-like protein n=1 Tax=Anopheles epiroticus TaxID=199890 RepID=A0A182PT06_9DIPT
MGQPATVILVVTFVAVFSVFQHSVTFVIALDDDRIVREQDSANAHGAPEIDTVEEEITLPKGVSWNFTCKSHQPIMWKGYASSYHWDPVNVAPVDFETDDPDKPYGSVLMLMDASADQVGRYYCINVQSYDEEREDELDDMVAEYLASTVYVYVNDPEQPLVPVHTPVFRVNQYEDFVIPCKPTHPDVEVEMYKDLEGELVETYRYSNTQGYLLSFNRLEDGGSYYCHAKAKPDQRIHFEVVINEHCEFTTTELLRPTSTTTSTSTIITTTTITTTIGTTTKQSRRRRSRAGAPTYDYLDEDAGNETFVGISVGYDNTTDEDRSSATTASSATTTPRYSHVSSHGDKSTYVPLISTITPISEYLTKPTIHSDTKDHVPLGQRIRLVCNVSIRAGVRLDMTWKVPPNLRPAVNGPRLKIGTLKLVPVKNAEHREVASRELIIERATLADDGTYRCEVQDLNGHRNYHSFKLHVRESAEDYVMLREENNLDYIHVRRSVTGRTHPIDIVIEYRAYPANITYFWFKDVEKEITAGHQGKYELSHSDTHVKLRINDPTVYDTGNYTVLVSAGNAEKSHLMAVYVHAIPIVHMESMFVKPNEEVSFQCRSIGYPRPDISFAFIPCLEQPWKNCSIATDKSKNWDGLKYVNLSFSTNNVNHQHPTAFYHNHIDSGSTQYVDPKKHLNSKGYVRHSGLQNMGMVDSCNTEVTAMTSHYLQLNEPYLQMNAEKMERGDTDYLANLGPPEEPAPTAPNYVNGIILPLPPSKCESSFVPQLHESVTNFNTLSTVSEIRNDKDYLKMSRTKSESEESNFDFASFNSDRHSPTIRNNLDTSPPNGSKRHKKRALPEEIPMLDGNRLSSAATNGFNSDSETEQVSPKPRERTSKHNPEPEYMNVKSHKFGGRTSIGDEGAGQEAISNPGYIALSMVDEKRC